MDENFTDGGGSDPSPQESDEQAQNAPRTTMLDASILDQQPQPGDTIQLRVVAIKGDEIEVESVESDQEDQDEGPGNEQPDENDELYS